MDLNSGGTVGGASSKALPQVPRLPGTCSSPHLPTPMTGGCLLLGSGRVSSPPGGSRPCHFFVFRDPHQRPSLHAGSQGPADPPHLSLASSPAGLTSQAHTYAHTQTSPQLLGRQFGSSLSSHEDDSCPPRVAGPSSASGALTEACEWEPWL